MTDRRTSRRRQCTICSGLSLHEDETGQSFCEKYFLKFLLELKEKLADEKIIEEHFNSSMFADEDSINQVTCTGLTLMHVNILGGKPLSVEWIVDKTTSIELGREESSANESDEGNGSFVPPYEESTAVTICGILLKRGASPNGNAVYEMRPLHIAIRREWTQVSRLLLAAGANPNIPERDLYASRPMDIAVVNDDPQTIELLHSYGASLNGIKSMFYLPPLAESFVRGYFDAFKVLLERGAKPIMDLHWNTFRSFGPQMFEIGGKGRGHFIQLMFDHGAEIQTQFKLCPIRVEPDGTRDFEPRFDFSCNPICIADLDKTLFIKWMCECRTLKELCRLAIRRYCFNSFEDGFQRLSRLKEQSPLNDQLFKYIMFHRQT